MRKLREGAPASAATLTGAVENGTDRKTAHVSTHEFTTAGGAGQRFSVADLLLCGTENAISRRDLVALIGFTDRKLRRQHEAERRQGCPILSDNVHGYFLPGDQSERDRCVHSLRRRAGEIMETAVAIEEAEV